MEFMIDRAKTHGPYNEFAELEQSLQEFLRDQPGWKDLTPTQKSVLLMVVHKVARILAGSPRHLDHWTDIAGYCQRAIEELRATDGATDTQTRLVTFRGGVWQ